MKEDGKFGRGVEMAGGGWETSARWKRFEVIQIWGSLPPTRIEAAVGRGDCFVWAKGRCPESFVCFVSSRKVLVVRPAAHTLVDLQPNGAN